MKRTDTKLRRPTDGRAGLLALLALLASTSCGAGRSPVDVEPAGPDGGAAAPAGAPAEADAPVEEPAEPPPGGSDLETRLVEMARATRGPEPDELPIKPFGVSWSPELREGHPFAVRIYERPTGRKPTAIEGVFAGRTVRFARFGPSGKWLGMGAVPIGQSDPALLELVMRFDDGSTWEQSVRVAVSSTSYPSSNLSVDPRFSSPPAEVLERIGREREMVRDLLSTVSPGWLLDAPFRPPRPLDVTSPFGQARMFNGELRSRHTGLDLRGREGAPVVAAGRGRVAFAGELYFAGNAVYVDHGLGVFTGYFHLSRIDVAEGDIVEPGTQVGLVGATGRVTAAHLHWYLAVDGTAVDAGGLLELDVPE